MCAYLIGSHARSELYLSDGGDTGQGFAAEPHGMEGEEVVGLPYLRCGMALERQAGIGLGHPFPVVDDLQTGASGIHDDDLDGLGFGVDSILYQLLYHGSRPLNDLTSCYLVGHRIREKVDNIQS